MDPKTSPKQPSRRVVLLKRISIPLIFMFQILLTMVGSAMFTRGFNFLLWTNAAVLVDIDRFSTDPVPTADEMERLRKEKRLQGILFVVFGIVSVGLAVGMFAVRYWLDKKGKNIGSTPLLTAAHCSA